MKISFAQVQQLLADNGLEVVKVANTPSNIGKGPALALRDALAGIQHEGSMRDGQRRTMRPASWISEGRNIEVVAHRIDRDTPLIEITLKATENRPESFQALTDVDADDLAARLRRACAVLPSSK